MNPGEIKVLGKFTQEKKGMPLSSLPEVPTDHI